MARSRTKIGCGGCLLLGVIAMSAFYIIGTFTDRQAGNGAESERVSAVNVTIREGTIPEDLDYEVTEQHRVPGVKLSFHVDLDRKVSEETLRAIAMKLKGDQSSQYERIFITYSLPGMTPDAGAWATTHFNPALKVEILGMTVEEAASLAEDTSGSGNADVIGQWRDEVVGYVVTIRRKEGSLILERKFRDGSSGTTELVERNVSGERRLARKDGRFGEYYVVDSKGNLKSFDEDGLIDTLLAIKK